MLVLNEELHQRTLLGGLMIISGIAIIVTRQAPKVPSLKSQA
jgi:drug/metabolite transporter (DMT)-like permease